MHLSSLFIAMKYEIIFQVTKHMSTVQAGF